MNAIRRTANGRRSLHLRDVRQATSYAALMTRLADADDVLGVLCGDGPPVTEFFPACSGGAVIWSDDGVPAARLFGITPPVDVLFGLAGWIRGLGGSGVFASETVAEHFAPFTLYQETAGRVMALTFEDPSLVDPSLVDPSLVDPSLVDPSLVERRHPVIFLFRPNGQATDDAAEGQHGASDSPWLDLIDLASTFRCAVISALRNRAERNRLEEQLSIAAAAFDSQDGMLVANSNDAILRVNRAFLDITGYTVEDVLGRSLTDIILTCHDADFCQRLRHDLQRRGTWKGEIQSRHKDGDIYPAWLTMTVIRNADDKIRHTLATINDITLRKATEDEIKSFAYYDPLTRLPNRRLLVNRLQQALVDCNRSGLEGALLFIDLDDFKTLNDTLGHDIGDQLLQQVARRLTNCVRKGDTVARMGGDEFVTLLTGLGSGEGLSQAEAVGKKILSALKQPYELLGRLHHSSASIGATLFGSQQVAEDELLKRAEIAMYQAKSAGRNTVRVFNPQMQAEVTARTTMEADLRRGLRADQLLLHFQPQVDGIGRLTGAEALVRWRHPERGLVSPAAFIPVAEESGLILPLGLWVLETACAQIAAWGQRAETAELTLAVNVSAKQFRQPDFVAQVLMVIEQTKADPRRLKLELTESMLLDNVQDIIGKMAALRECGINFSLDDFGTGYSSLSYLKRLPLSQLKIDQSFVRDVLTDPNDAAIAQTIIALGQSLSLKVIAEGVETDGQRAFLARYGCHAYQGYLFGRPMPVDEFERRLEADTSGISEVSLPIQTSGPGAIFAVQ